MCVCARARARACLRERGAEGVFGGETSLSEGVFLAQVKIYSLTGHVVRASMHNTLDPNRGLGNSQGGIRTRIDSSKKVMNRLAASLQGQEAIRTKFYDDGRHLCSSFPPAAAFIEKID